MQLFPKIPSDMANSVDHKEEHRSGSTLFAYAIMSDILVYGILGH